MKERAGTLKKGAQRKLENSAAQRKEGGVRARPSSKRWSFSKLPGKKEDAQFETLRGGGERNGTIRDPLSKAACSTWFPTFSKKEMGVIQECHPQDHPIFSSE